LIQPNVEFSRRIALDRLGPVAHTERIEADEAERTALAARFGWRSLGMLAAEMVLTVRDGGIDAEGSLRAELVQNCVASDAPVPATIAQPFRVRFVPEAMLTSDAEEVELTADDLDLVTHDGAAVDLGEAVAQTLALAVDPFPRAPDADARLKAAGVLGEGETGPFAGLKGLLGG